jgi:RNase H-fold protein (predicted Holliday junction resolvase)
VRTVCIATIIKITATDSGQRMTTVNQLVKNLETRTVHINKPVELQYAKDVDDIEDYIEKSFKRKLCTSVIANMAQNESISSDLIEHFASRLETEDGLQALTAHFLSMFIYAQPITSQ